MRWVPRWLRWSFAAIVTGLIVRFLVVPRLSDLESGVGVLDDVGPVLLLAGTALTAVSIVSQAILTMTAVPTDDRPGILAMLRIELAATAVSHTVPGGTAAGTALGFRLMSQAGVPRPEAGFALGIRGIGSAAVLNVLLAVALVVSIVTQGFNPIYTTAAALGAAALGGLAVATILLVKGERGVARTIKRVVRPIPLLDEEAVPAVVGRIADRMRELLSDRGLAARATAWSAAYWLTGAASLWVFLAAFGFRADPVSLFVAFGVANVLAAIPVTPRGLGVVEGVMIPMLIGFGASGDAATLGVIGWRLVSFWLPIPVGAASYVSLRVGPAALEEAVEKARGENLRQWARERGVDIGGSHPSSAPDQ